MLEEVKLLALLSFRFLLLFLINSFLFIVIFYLNFRLTNITALSVDYDIFYKSFLFSFPLTIVMTFLKLSFPFDFYVMKGKNSYSLFYKIVFSLILFFSYLGFLSIYFFNTNFLNFSKDLNNFNYLEYLKNDISLKESLVYLDDNLYFFNNKNKDFNFSGILEASTETYSTLGYFMSLNKDKIHLEDLQIDINSYVYGPKSFVNNVFEDSMLFNIFVDIKSVTDFLIGQDIQFFILNILGFVFLLHSFSFTFNLLCSRDFIILTFPLAVFLFFKLYRIYSHDFLRLTIQIFPDSKFSYYVPFLFCFLTFFSTYFLGFIFDYIQEELEEN